jgi:hypothetical protein
MSRLINCFLLVVLVAACSRDRSASATSADVRVASRDSATKDSIARARQDSINHTLPGYVVDSILPVEEMLRRFRTAVGGEPVTAFQYASDSRDALVARFMKAVASSDSLDLHRMALNAREFADLVYPESPNTHPPYRQDPALMWRTIQNPSVGGLTRLLRRTAEIPANLQSYECTGRTEQQGKNTLIGRCFLRVADTTGAISTHRYFGTIIERGGKFKIVSYRNEF